MKGKWLIRAYWVAIFWLFVWGAIFIYTQRYILLAMIPVLLLAPVKQLRALRKEVKA